MLKLNELFDVSYGNKFDLNKMELLPRADGGVSFVGRSEKNLGVSATVARIDGVEPYPAGLITVALGGSILCSYVQQHPFYTAQNVAVLSPKSEMTFEQLVYMCVCIKANRFRYGTFGREANRTLRVLPVPDINADVPEWLKSGTTDLVDLQRIAKPIDKGAPADLNQNAWQPFVMGEIFDIRRGSRITKLQQKPGLVPFIGAVDKNNGLTSLIDAEPLHPAGTITVNYNGSVAEAFYQPRDYWCSDDVNVLYPRDGGVFEPAVAMFIVTVIRQEKYRFSYGRKWHTERMRASTISLPAKATGNAAQPWVPDWEGMGNYVRRLPYSSSLISDAA